MGFTINPLLVVVIYTVIFCIVIVSIINGKKFKQTTIASSTEHKREKMKKIIATIFFVIGGVPLCIYPLVIIANLMSLAGFWPAQVNVLLMIFFCLFLLLSSVYPITYIICILQYKKGDKNVLLPIIPLLHLLSTIGLGLLCSLLETKRG